MNDYDAPRDWCMSCGGSNVIEIDHEWLDTVTYCMDCGEESDDSGETVVDVVDRNQLRRSRARDGRRRRRNSERNWD